MARIQLRNTTIFLQDGLAGSGEVSVGNSSLAATPVTRVTAGGGILDEVQEISQFGRAPSGGTYTLHISDGVNSFTTAGIAYNAAAATIETAIDSAATAASYPSWTNGDISVTESDSAGISDGTVTLTFDGTSVAATGFELTVIDGTELSGTVVSSGTVLGVDAVSLNSDDADRIPVGARFTIAGESGTPVHTVVSRYNNQDDETLHVTITPGIASAVADEAVITFLPQRVEVKIGEGDLSWTESREMIYDLDRDLLDTVREGQEQPVEVELNFVFEYVSTEAGQALTPVDVLKRLGEASEFVSSSDDLCEPYAVDLYAIHCVPCGTDLSQDFLFKDFRWESLDYSVQDASIAVSGRCNVSSVISTRDSFTECDS